MAENYKNAGVNNSVLRACLILDLFTPSKSEWSLKEIAQQCDIGVTTVMPLLRSLETVGYLERNPNTKMYCLGMKFIEKSQVKLNSLNIIDCSKDLLRRMSEQYGVNTHLAVLDRGEIVYLSRYAAMVHSLIPSHVGKRLPVYCTALGKAILANLDASEAGRVLAMQEFRQYTPKTVQDADALRVQLEQVRANGYAVDDEEHQMGSYCLAAPVFASNGTVCAAISASIVKTDERMRIVPALTDVIRECAAQISKNIGYRGFSDARV